MEIEYLKEQWTTITALYSNPSVLVEKLWKEIEENYCQSNRHYHNLDHLSYMFKKANEYKANLEDFDTLSFSIFYHDFIYNTKRSNNEEKSAEAARERLTKLGVPRFKIVKCQQQIMATKAHREDDDTDRSYLVDFDLAILGEDSETYQNYTRKIRKEYSLYPNILYNPGRKKVLKHFLEMDNIFKMPDFRNRYEEQVRKNIQYELENL